jgi:hypothetical protein
MNPDMGAAAATVHLVLGKDVPEEHLVNLRFARSAVKYIARVWSGYAEDQPVFPEN